MRSDPQSPGGNRPEKPFKLLLWAAVISLIFGALGIGQILEDTLRVARNGLHPNKASGDIVLVEIDEHSLNRIGEWPWPRATQAKLIDEANRLGAKQIFVDIIYENLSDPKNDQALASAIQRGGTKVVLAARKRVGPAVDRTYVEGMPHPMFRRTAKVGNVTGDYNYQHAIWHLPYSTNIQRDAVPTTALMMTNQPVRNGTFRVDYSIDVASVPRISSADLLEGKIAREQVSGKTLVIGQSAEQLGDQYWIPGKGRMAGAYVQILGAETLRLGTPIDFGWLPATFLTSCVLVVSLLRSGRRRTIGLTGMTALLLIVPAPLEANLIYLDSMPAFLMLGIVSGRLGWLRWRKRGYTNLLSGLPNLEAFRARRNADGQALVAARVHNYAEIASSLTDEEEQDLIRQVADRLSVTNAEQQIFQGDEGIFAWIVDGSKALGNHLEALHALFRSPVTAGGRSIDIAISFGAELGSDRSVSNRLGSALVAADEAWSDGLKWKLHDPSREEEVSWRLSLLSRLDAAIDSGEVWIAFQPQYDLQTRKIVGAEALARWTHPDKGPISPTEFIAAAEAHGRISKLTDFVLDRSISMAAGINRRGTCFSIAVNLSARLLGDRQLIQRVQRMLTIHGLEPGLLTLELTETAAITETDNAIGLLDQLKQLGVRIAIDDYGTGLSTLDYLKKVPADEIKIDQSFVRGIRVNRSDLIMVQSTIALAHSLGRKVVAEGVEDHQVLDDLRNMHCDLAQGFVVGRPMGVRELVARLTVQQEKRVA